MVSILVQLLDLRISKFCFEEVLLQPLNRRAVEFGYSAGQAGNKIRKSLLKLSTSLGHLSEEDEKGEGVWGQLGQGRSWCKAGQMAENSFGLWICYESKGFLCDCTETENL